MPTIKLINHMISSESLSHFSTSEKKKVQFAQAWPHSHVTVLRELDSWYNSLIISNRKNSQNVSSVQPPHPPLEHSDT